MRQIPAIYLVLFLCVSNLSAQSPATEMEWRSAMREAENHRSAGNKMKWTGIIVSIASSGFFTGGVQTKSCVVNEPYTGVPGECAALRNSNGMKWAGLGVLGGGVTLAAFGTHKK